MVIRIICLIISFFLYSVFSVAQGDVKSIIEPNIDDDEYFSQTFTLFADLTDGAYIYGQIGVSNIGPGNNRGVCRVLIAPKNKKIIDQSIIVNSEEWSYEGQRNPKFSVRDCELIQDDNNQKLIFSGKIDQQQIRIALHAEPKKKIPPMGRLHTRSGYYFSDILVPWAESTVEYVYSGEKKTSKGFGYADHSRSTMLPTKIAHQWVRFRGINDNNSHLILARQPTKKDVFTGWDWRQKNSQPRIIRHLSIQQKGNAQFPEINFVSSDNDYQIQIQELLLRYAPLEEKGFLMKVISYAIGNPVTYTYRANLVSSSGEKIPGMLEVAEINGN